MLAININGIVLPVLGYLHHPEKIDLGEVAFDVAIHTVRAATLYLSTPPVWLSILANYADLFRLALIIRSTIKGNSTFSPPIVFGDAAIHLAILYPFLVHC